MRSAPAGTIAGAITAHLAARAASGDAPATVARCRTHLTRFATWCEARGLTTLDHLTPAILERYQEWLNNRRQQDGRPLAWSTQAHELTAVRMLVRGPRAPSVSW